jgi:hypothetical protein
VAPPPNAWLRDIRLDRIYVIPPAPAPGASDADVSRILRDSSARRARNSRTLAQDLAQFGQMLSPAVAHLQRAHTGLSQRFGDAKRTVQSYFHPPAVATHQKQRAAPQTQQKQGKAPEKQAMVTIPRTAAASTHNGVHVHAEGRYLRSRDALRE